MKTVNILRNILGALILLVCAAIASSCANPAVTATVTRSSSVSSPVQAAYNTLDITSPTAWQAASAAGYVRQGTVLVKTGAGFNASSLATLGATQNGSLAGIGGTWRHLSVTKGSETSVIAALRTVRGVIAAEPEMILHVPEGENSLRKPGLPTSVTGNLSSSGIASRGLTSSTVLDDPYVQSAQYSLTITNAIGAYAGNYPLDGTKSAYVAIFDTGLNMAHQEFNVGWQSPTNPGTSIVAYAKSAFSQNSATSYTYVGDGNPFVTVPAGSNWDDDGHGTHVAGIIGALGNNGVGIAGVMWNGLHLISYKVLTDNESDNAGGSGSDWAIFGALSDLTTWWSVSSNHLGSPAVLPVNMSLGGYYATSFESEMIANALQKNVVIVAAMGNDGRTTAEYPGAYSGVIAVGATDGTDTIATFSTTGPWISVTAPGVDIISTYNGSPTDYEYDSGTSMATPFVAGLSAYALAYAPTLLPDQLKTILMNSADFVQGNTGFTNTYGAGRVNVLRTLTSATTSVPASGSVYSAQPLKIAVTVSGQLTGGVPVYIYDSSGAYVTFGYTANDGSGSVSFWLLKPGSYTARTDNPGNETLSPSISINVPTGVTKTISL